MHDSTMSRLALTAYLLWTAVSLLVGAAWLLMAINTEAWRWSGLLAVTGLALSAVAATAHMKVYAVRVCGLVRATSGINGAETRPAELHALR